MLLPIPVARKDSNVHVCLLGSYSIEFSESVVTQFRWSRIPALLRYLLIHEGPTSRERIAEALWPDRPPERSRQNLRQTVLYLNEILGDESNKGFTSDRSSLALDRNFVTADIDAFLSPPPKGESHEEARVRHEKRFSCYRGPFLATFDDDWVIEARAQIARAYLESVLFLSADALSADASKSLELAELAIKLEPFEDSPRIAKIKALKALGREANAQKEYNDFAELIQEQLQLNPGKLVLQALKDAKQTEPLVQLRPDLSDAGAPTIRETLEFLTKQGLGEAAIDLVRALVPFWIRMGTPSQGQALLEQTFVAAGRSFGHAERISLVRLFISQGDQRRARQMLEQLAGEPLLKPHVGEVELLLGRIDLLEVRSLSAKLHSIVALRIIRKVGNTRLELEGWMALAMAFFSNDEFKRVERTSQRVIELADKLGDRLSKNHMTIYRAFAWHRLGESHRSHALVTQICRELSPATTGTACQILCSASRLQEDLGFIDLALQGYRDCIADCRRLSTHHTLGIVLTYLGDLECEHKQFQTAYKIHSEAIELRRALDQNLGLATSLRGAGKALLGLGQAPLAKELLQESAQRFRDENAQSGHASALILMAEAEALSGDISLAIRVAENAIEILRLLGPTGRLAIGPSGANILERAESLLESMVRKRDSSDANTSLCSMLS